MHDVKVICFDSLVYVVLDDIVYTRCRSPTPIVYTIQYILKHLETPLIKSK
jgi:hypothetical protein